MWPFDFGNYSLSREINETRLLDTRYMYANFVTLTRAHSQNE